MVGYGAIVTNAIANSNIPALGINTMPVDALVPRVARAAAGMAYTGKDRRHLLLIQS